MNGPQTGILALFPVWQPRVANVQLIASAPQTLACLATASSLSTRLKLPDNLSLHPCQTPYPHSSSPTSPPTPANVPTARSRDTACSGSPTDKSRIWPPASPASLRRDKSRKVIASCCGAKFCRMGRYILRLRNQRRCGCPYVCRCVAGLCPQSLSAGRLETPGGRPQAIASDFASHGIKRVRSDP